MADMQQLESAFLKAHKAGDTKAAGVLAAEIKRQRASKGSSAPTPEDAPVSGLADQWKGGLESSTEMPGISLEAGGKALDLPSVEGAGTWMRDLTEAPKDFVSAGERFSHPKPGDSYVDPVLGFGWGNAAGAAAEGLGSFTGSLAVRGTGAGVGAVAGGAAGAAGGAMAGGVGAVPGAIAGAATGAGVGAVTAPAVFGFLSTVGPVALARAQADGREEPNWEDWSIAAGTGTAAGVLEVFGVGKIGILNNALKDVAKTTTKGIVTTTGKDIAKGAGREFVSETGQSIVQQAGETVGTDQGLSIDLKEAVGQGIVGGMSGGIADATTRIPMTYGKLADSMSVDSTMRNSTDGRAQAELTLDVNDIANRMKGANKDPLGAEITSNVSDYRRQVAEALDGQNLAHEDIKALKGAMIDAKGLSSKRLNEIAGRSDNPSEIKALARKIQVIREVTMQKPTAKGARGWAAQAAATLGGAAGYGIDLALTGGGLSALAGIVGGQSVGRDIARRLRGSQTQGNAIDSLVGKKQARRAQMLLDRYGPSEATKALHTLTEQAAARTEQENAQTEAITETNRILKETKEFQKTRAKMQDDIRKETDATAKKEKQAAKDKFDSANRDTRLKNAALTGAMRQARTDLLAQKLDHQKNIDALTVEMTKTRAELQQKEASAKADKLDRNAEFEIANLRGKMDMMALDIEKRQLALKKQGIITQNAEKRAARTPEDIKPTVSIMAKAAKKRLDKLSPDQLQDPKLDQFGQGIRDEGHYAEQKARIIALENEGLQAADAFPDKKIGNILIGAIRDFQSYRGRKNQEKRMKVYHRVANQIPEANVEAHRLIESYIRPLAHAFEADGPGAEDSNTTDYGNEDTPSDYTRRNPNAEMDIPF